MATHAADRVREIRHAIYFGLVLYNVYNITSIILLTDILSLSVFRTPFPCHAAVSLLLAWMVGKTQPKTSERIVLGGVLNAYLLPLFLFWLTNAPLGLFTFANSSSPLSMPTWS